VCVEELIQLRDLNAATAAELVGWWGVTWEKPLSLKDLNAE
jgi:hypothetical protein